MHACSFSLIPIKPFFPSSNLNSSLQPGSLFPVRTFGYEYYRSFKVVLCKRMAFSQFNNVKHHKWRECRRFRNVGVKASSRELPHEVLGVSASATVDEIKRAFRKLALKYHPDVNKVADSQERFMRIQHAYDMLLNSGSWGKYDNEGRVPDFSYHTGIGDEGYFQFGEAYVQMEINEDLAEDVQGDLCNWGTSFAAEEKPKTLLEKLSEIGGGFVNLLKRKMNILDDKAKEDKKEKWEDGDSANISKDKASKYVEKQRELEESIDEIDAVLARLERSFNL